jgi:hypothetical protein
MTKRSRFRSNRAAARRGSTMTTDGIDFNAARRAGGMLDSLGPGSIAEILVATRS